MAVNLNERPAFITLRLLEDRIKHPTVSWVQQLINTPDRSKPKEQSKWVEPPLVTDGEFGPHTAQELEEFQYRLGFPNPKAAASPADLEVLWNWYEGRGLPDGYGARIVARRTMGFVKGWGITARSWIGLHPGQFQPTPTPGELVIVSRGAIGLRPPRSRTFSPTPPTDGAVFHWQGSGHGAVGLEAAKAQFRAWQAYHMDTHGWSDIGYNFGIPRGCPVGTVFEGRGFGVWGAHAGSSGNDELGVLFMCGSADGGPTADQFATAQMFRALYARGRPTGHREHMQTSCPGDAAMAWVRSQR